MLDYLTVTRELSDAANADKDRFVSIPKDGAYAGEWKLVGANWIPETAVTADATENRVLSLKVGSTTYGTLTTDTDTAGYSAWVAGTVYPFTLSGDCVLTAGADALEIDSTHGGSTGKVATGCIQLLFKQVRV